MMKSNYLKLNSKHLIRGLKGIIPGGMSVTDFSAVTQFDHKLSLDILLEFEKNGIGTKENDSFIFTTSDRLKAALLLLEHGFPLDNVSESLDWKNFEGLVSEILESKNFATIRNLYLSKPKMEIDVVGIRLGVAMLVDCKHWKYSSHSGLINAVNNQIKRTKHYVSKTHGAVAIPVIVTLYSDKVDFIDRVPIVPIFQFSSFVDEFYGNLDQMNTIKTD